MFLQKLFHKSTATTSPQHHQQSPPPPQPQEVSRVTDIDPRVAVHYGIPTTASVLAFDPIQSLLAVGTLDGRIKVIGGSNIEGLLMSPKQVPFKHLEFLLNQGFIVSVSNENDIQVWDLKHRGLASSLHWESNITAFSVVHHTSYMYIGDEYGTIYVLKYDAGEEKLVHLPYQISQELLAEVSGISSSDNHSVVGLLPQPCSCGNRLLIAYDNGLIILWDVSEDRAVLVRGNNDIELKDARVAHTREGTQHELSDEENVDKEISSVCWASNDGSVLAVGYVDGDIMLWNMSTADDHKNEKSSQQVVKLQLSSSSRRLPVITLHWSENKLAQNGCGCRLFVYGGDDIGSEEVLTILSLDWSSGTESLKCLGRADLTLNGSFADMVLFSSAGDIESNDSLFVLTNPGQLHVYDDACLSALISQQEKKAHLSAMQYPMVIPIAEPCMTVGKHGRLHQDENLSKIVTAVNLQRHHASTEGNSSWPLTGGVYSQLFDPESYQVKRVYIAGYQDGSIRIWDITSAILTLLYVIGSEVKDAKVAGLSAPVSALDLCPYTSDVAVGNQHGLVRLYKLTGSSVENSLHIVTENGTEVQKLQDEDKPPCVAVFSILNSPVVNLQFANSGARLAVGFDSGQAAMLDMSTSSVLFLTDCVPNSTSPVVSLALKPLVNPNGSKNSAKDPETNSMTDVGNEVLFVLTKNGDTILLDGTTGNMVSSTSLYSKESKAVCLHIIEGGNYFQEVSSEKHLLKLSPKNGVDNEPSQTGSPSESTSPLLNSPTETTCFAEKSLDTLVLLCFENELILHPLESTFQDDRNSICNVTLDKPCCWTTTYKKDETECGLIVLYQNGIIGIRSLPNLEGLQEISLMSILRWSFKSNMEKTICFDEGQLALVNGCEFAVISLFSSEHDIRILESLPLLHDEVLAVAAESTADLHANGKKKQGSAFGFMENIVKGFKAEDQDIDSTELLKNYRAHLEEIFSRSPLERIFSKTPHIEPPGPIKDDKEVIELNIDDIEIDEPVTVSLSSKGNNNMKGKETERERLFEGSTTSTEPRARSVAEIKAKYKKTGGASEAASQARDKLMERGEKLERLSKRTEELQSGAENFASMANELAKTMEKRKWWNI